MGKRKLEVGPEEVSSNFKKSKFKNANDIVKLLIQIESGSTRQILPCIAALSEIAQQIIKNGDGVKPSQQKPDDLKDALDVYHDWIYQRYIDIIKKLIELLHHSRSTVGEAALHALLELVRLRARLQEKFPWMCYSSILGALLHNKVDCRKLIRTLREPLQHQDLAYYTFRVVSKLVARRGPGCSSVYKGNLVALLVLLQVPPKKKPFNPPPLWCSVRISRNKSNTVSEDKDKGTELKKEKKDKTRSKAEKKKLKKDKSEHHRKSKYQELLETSERGQAEDDEDRSGSEEEEGEEAAEEEVIQLAELDSEEEQRRVDDQEFKAGQKKEKKPRRRRYVDDAAEDVTEDSVDTNKIPLPKLKVKLGPVKDRLLPPGVFSGGDRLGSQAENSESESEGESEGEEDSEGEGESEGEEGDMDDRGPVFKYSFKLARLFLTNIWEKLMSFPLTEELYKRCLVFIPDQVMEFLNDPVKLTDFFISSYNCGGGVSLMAMHGVFLLMNKYNLQYPDFYQKVYGLLEPSVLAARYKPRFFVLLNAFLSSSHLPEYMAAAFVKRLECLLLCSNAPCSLLVTKCLSNLLARFPSLRVMYDDEGHSAPHEDPFLLMVADLKESHASQSSLWAVATISRSAPQSLYKATSFTRKTGFPEEVDLTEYLETEYDELEPSVAADAASTTKVSSCFTPIDSHYLTTTLRTVFDREASQEEG